jgi:hypothetical protein
MFDNFHFNNELFSVTVFVICAIYLIKLFKHFHDTNNQDWSDIVTQNGTNNKVSLTKTMQVVGLFVSSWAIVHVTIFGKLTFDLFGLYLAYVGGSEGYSKYLKAKHGFNPSDQNQEPEPEPLSIKQKSKKNDK